ncbi:MAG: ring-opening amidohydrolase [Ilumatobacter sp.]|nr:ring-opening amidohydrolase [Ilumatobacter sp.]
MSMDFAGKTAVVGIGATDFSKNSGRSTLRLAVECSDDAIRDAGLDLPERPIPEDLDGRVVNCFIKCEADPTSRLRGRRQVALNDSDIHHTHHTKGAVGGVAAAALGDPAVFVSVAGLQSGPSGGGSVAAIVDLG